MLDEAGIEVLGNEGFMKHIAVTDFVDIMEKHLARLNEEQALEEAPAAIRKAGRHTTWRS